MKRRYKVLSGCRQCLELIAMTPGVQKVSEVEVKAGGTTMVDVWMDMDPTGFTLLIQQRSDGVVKLREVSDVTGLD